MDGDAPGDSRFKFYESAPAAPGQCMLSGHTRNLVDLDYGIKMYGRAYICVECLKEIAQVAHIVDFKEDQSIALAAAFAAGRTTERELHESVNDAVRNLVSAAAALGGGADVVLAAAASLEPAVESDEPAQFDGLLRAAPPGAGGAGREDSATDGGERRGDLQRADLNDANFAI